MKRSVAPEIIAAYHRRRQEAVGRAAKKQVMDDFCNLTGLSQSAAYARFQAIDRGAAIYEVAKGRQRGKKQLSETEERELRQIASMKMTGLINHQGRTIVDGALITTHDAIGLCEREGLIRPGKWTVSTTDRWMYKHGLSQTWQRMERANSVSWKADHPLQIVMLDASPLNRHYMRLDRRDVVARTDLFTRDTHLGDIMRRDGLEKIWVWVYVDVFSNAFHLRAFPGPGEHTADVLNFLTECILPKPPRSNNPLEGVPHFLYTDKGSAIWSRATQNYCLRLGIRMEHHMPGNPRAKGRVEARIGAFKKRFETMLNLIEDRHISSIEKLNYYLQGFAAKRNREMGSFDRFKAGAVVSPIRKATIQNIRDAAETMFVAKVNAYGCIRHKGKERYVSNELYVGQEVEVYRNLDGAMIAQDPRSGKVYAVQETGRRTITPVDDKGNIGKNYAHNNADTVAWTKSEDERLRDDIMKDARAHRKTINLESLPIDRGDDNVRTFPAAGSAIETEGHFAVPAEIHSVDQAIVALYHRTGFKMSEFSEEFQDQIRNGLGTIIAIAGHITDDDINRIANTMLDTIEKQRNKKEG